MDWITTCSRTCWSSGASSLLLLALLSVGTAKAATTFNVLEERRSYDGRNNNRQNPLWGSIDTPRIRQQVPPPYTDRSSSAQLPSARRVMEEVFRKAKPHADKTTNHVLIEFGHFIVQDILGSSLNETESMPIPCDGKLTDYVFCPVLMKQYMEDEEEENDGDANPYWSIYNEYTMDFFRQTHTFVESNNNTTQPQQQRSTINGMTAFLDLSNLYGLSYENSLQMRDPGQAGKFYMTSDTNLPPFDDDSHYLPPAMKGGMNTSPGAFAFYVLFMRYHNYVADTIYADAADHDGDKIFETARQQTIAVYQNLVEEAYLPTLLGGDKLDTYQGYLSGVNPSIDEFFSAVSFRYAHTAFGGLVRMVDSQFQPTPDDPLLLREVFKQNVPDLVVNQHGGIEPFVRGLVVTPAKAMDASFVDDLNLWSEATSVVDVQRGRDVGIPSYNIARQQFGLPRIESLEELVGDSYGPELLESLRTLYHNNIDLVDAYVGAVMEVPQTKLDLMGPLFSLSIKDQFTRLRDGDRFWYKNLYDKDTYENFPTMSEFIKLLCDKGTMEFFPEDAFRFISDTSGIMEGGAQDDTGGCDASSGAADQLSFLNGDFVVKWEMNNDDDTEEEEETETTIDVTLTVMEPMEGPGYIGIGWRERQMKGASIWFCTIDYELLLETQDGLSSGGCDISQHQQQQGVISCCLSPGENHEVPKCSEPGDDIHYSLEVIDWCLSEEQSSVTVRALVCGDDNNNSTTTNNKSDCFEIESTDDGKMDVCVAYNPLSRSRPHGYQRRTGARIDLRAGMVTHVAGVSAGGHGTAENGGLIATHGAFMLIGWVVLAPIGVYVVRYMKTKSWRLVAHISIMSFIGSMMIPLFVGVVASVGETDKTQDHSLVGIIILSIFFLMAGTGRYRYIKWQGQKLGKKTDIFTIFVHRLGGVTFIILAWWNCYTGLVRISPEDDSSFEFFAVTSYSMGYDMNIFGFVKKYLYGPWIAFVVTMFAIAEFKKRRSGTAQAKMKDNGSLWDDDGSELKTMSLNTFLDVTRLGNCLTIIDGRILDITDWIFSHPGGPEMLRYVRGSDITEEFLGRQGVEGIRHMHSHAALQLVKSFVVAKIGTGTDTPKKSPRGREPLAMLKSKLQFSSVFNLPSQPALPFRRGKVIDVQYLAPTSMALDQKKPVILLQLSIPRKGAADKEDKVTKLPGCSFRFRGIDKKGIMFEREYTAVRVARQTRLRCSTLRQPLSLTSMDGASAAQSARFLPRRGSMGQGEPEEEECYDFVISLVPGGQMSNFFLGLKTGKVLLAQGPKVSPRCVSIFSKPNWKSVVFMAGGTGISPALQLIDFYLEKEHRNEIPFMFLIWVIKSPRHSFHETLGLKHRVRASAGRLKVLTIYSSVGDDSSSISSNPDMCRICGSKRNHEGNGKSCRRWMRASQVDRPGWARALQHEQPSSSWMRTSQAEHYQSVATIPEDRPLFAGLFSWGDKRAKVRDLIARAQSTGIEGSETFSTTEEPGHEHVLDCEFWIQPMRSITRNLDQPLVEGLLSSSHEYREKQELQASSLNSSARFVDRELSSLTITPHNANEKTSSISDDTHEDEKEPIMEPNKVDSAEIDGTTTKDDSKELDVTTRTAEESVCSESAEKSTGEEGTGIFKGTLVALSGPPKFESFLSSRLANIGLPKKQLITFGVGTQHV